MGYPSDSRRSPRGYFETSRTLTYSMLSVVPLLVIYEVGIWLINRGSDVGVRNAADAALKEPFLLLGPYGRHLFVAAVLLAALAVYRYEALPRRIRLKGPYFALMLGESLVYALGFGGAVHLILSGLSWIPFLAGGIEGLDAPSQFVLSLGAGLYEELVFRVILVSALFLMLQRLTRTRRASVYVAAALLGALLFSAYHYVGPVGDRLEVHSFVYRFVAGLILNAIYLGRGFGIAAYTHALYDVLVLFRSV